MFAMRFFCTPFLYSSSHSLSLAHALHYQILSRKQIQNVFYFIYLYVYNTSFGNMRAKENLKKYVLSCKYMAYIERIKKDDESNVYILVGSTAVVAAAAAIFSRVVANNK